MKSITAQEAKEIRLELLKELDRFCTESGIHYYLGFGTLIGAVRHNGFIPWDDDCDVLVPRPDLIRLQKEYTNTDRYVYISNLGDNHHIYGFDRLVDRRTYQKVGNFKVQGVNIELYPIDGCPNNTIIRNAYFWLIHKLFKIEDRLFKKAYGGACSGTWKLNVLKPWWMMLYLRFYHQIGTIFRYNRHKNVCVLFGNPYKLKAMQSDWFEEGQIHVFESLKLKIPLDYNSYLSQIYGDYMTPPPIEKQIPSHGGELYWY